MCPCRTPRKLFDSCIYLKYCSHHQSDLFHVSLARKKERFLRLKGNKVHQQEFLRFHISWPRRNEWLFIWPSALHRDLSEFYTSSGAKVQLVTFQKLYRDNSLFLFSSLKSPSPWVYGLETNGTEWNSQWLKLWKKKKNLRSSQRPWFLPWGQNWLSAAFDTIDHFCIPRTCLVWLQDPKLACLPFFLWLPLPSLPHQFLPKSLTA